MMRTSLWTTALLCSTSLFLMSSAELSTKWTIMKCFTPSRWYSNDSMLLACFCIRSQLLLKWAYFSVYNLCDSSLLPDSLPYWRLTSVFFYLLVNIILTLNRKRILLCNLNTKSGWQQFLTFRHFICQHKRKRMHFRLLSHISLVSGNNRCPFDRQDGSSWRCTKMENGIWSVFWECYKRPSCLQASLESGDPK